MVLNKTNSVAFSPRANYTDWGTATCPSNLVPTFADRGVSRGQRGGSRTVVNLSFLDRSGSSFTLTRAKWTTFQTHCYSENLVAPGIEPGTSGLPARNWLLEHIGSHSLFYSKQLHNLGKYMKIVLTNSKQRVACARELLILLLGAMNPCFLY
jgi:hypothetical protein